MARRAPRQEEEGARKLFDETPQPVAFSGEGKLVIWLQSSQTPCPGGNGGYGVSGFSYVEAFKVQNVCQIL